MLLVAILGTVLPSVGCQTASGTGALAGGALGAGIGALAGGKHNGNAALAGGLIGAAAGGLAGAAVDANREKKEAQAVAQAAAIRAPSLEQVVEMTQNHVDDAVIINQIRSSGAVYTLTAEQVVWLKQNGVSSAVIAEMQNTAYRPVRRVYAATPPPAVVVYEQPPPVVGIRATFR
jgi:hypothetical protein